MRDDQGNSESQLPDEAGPGNGTSEGGGQDHPIQPAQAQPDHSGGDGVTDGPVYGGLGFSQPGPGYGGPGQPGPGYGEPGPGYGEPGPAYGGPGYSQPGPAYGGPGQPGPGYGGPGYSQPGPGYGGQGGGPGPGGYGGYGGPGQDAGGYGQPTGPHPMPYSYPGYGQPGYPPQGAGARRRRSLLTYLTVAVVAAATGAGLTGYALSSNPAPTANGQRQQNGTGSGVLPGGTGSHRVSSTSERAAVSAVRPAIVDISSNLAYQGSQAAATGMVISSDGLVLTNNHVINGTTQLYATVLASGHKYQAQWVGYDATDDVAVIKLVGAHNLRTVPLGNSNLVKLGDRVIAIGNAYGADRNPAYVGSITGLNRTITASDSGAATKETLHGMLQTNAGIVEGDSGGPLITAAGQVIGMDTAAATGSFGTTTQDVGFAIPINRALRIARQIISGQSSPTVQIGSTGFMGVLVPSRAASVPTSPAQQRLRQIQQDQSVPGSTVPPATSACLPTDLTAGVPARVAPVSSGALVIGQLCGTPADKAGLIAGDVITSVGGHAVTSPAQLTTVMHGFKPGMAVKVSWVDIRGGKHAATLDLIPAPPH